MQSQASNQSSEQIANIIRSGHTLQPVDGSDSSSHSINHISIPEHPQETPLQCTDVQVETPIAENQAPQFITVTVYNKEEDCVADTKSDHGVFIAIRNDMCSHQMETPNNSKLNEQGNQEQGALSFQSGDSGHPTFVQYVDGPNDPTLYTASNGQMTSYPSYTVIGSTMTTPYSGTSFNYTQIDANEETPAEVQTPVVSNQPCNNFTVPGNALDGDGRLATCASPATVQWLIDNYETAEGVSLPRSTLYSHYLRHCAENKLDPINAASFGKLIRSVFLGLRTRRLGTRGNSKYHYYGIRVKSNSSLNHLTELGSIALRQQPASQARRYKQHSVKSEVYDRNDSTESRSQQQSHHLFLGDSSSAIPTFVDIDIRRFMQRGRIKDDELRAFISLYREHCEDVLEAVINLQFSRIETIWQNFWQLGDTYRQSEHAFDSNKFYALCQEEPILHFIRQADYQFYQNLVDVLIPNVLRPIPGTLTQAVRNFAKNIEAWLTAALVECPEEIVKLKVGAVCAFSQTLRRYTSLNHLAQAARAVLQNPSQIHQMMTDLNRVDFHNVQEQASWVCQCEDDMVDWIQQDFKTILQQQNSLEHWAGWLENVVNMVLQPHEGKADFSKAARQFLLKWSFYSSMVIRDLTLRSAASFGSFHLIRLLYDEYMFYLIEHRVAKVTGETPMAVMGELIGLSLSTCHKTARQLPKLKYSNGDEEQGEQKSTDSKPSDLSYNGNGMKDLLNQSILANLLGHSQDITNKKVKVG